MLNIVCRIKYTKYSLLHTVYYALYLTLMILSVFFLTIFFEHFFSIITRKDQKAATLDRRNEEIIIAKRKELTKRILEMWHGISAQNKMHVYCENVNKLLFYNIFKKCYTILLLYFYVKRWLHLVFLHFFIEIAFRGSNLWIFAWMNLSIF